MRARVRMRICFELFSLVPTPRAPPGVSPRERVGSDGDETMNFLCPCPWERITTAEYTQAQRHGRDHGGAFATSGGLLL